MTCLLFKVAVGNDGDHGMLQNNKALSADTDVEETTLQMTSQEIAVLRMQVERDLIKFAAEGPLLTTHFEWSRPNQSCLGHSGQFEIFAVV